MGDNVNKLISVPQLITLLIINRIVISMTFGSSSIGGYNIWDCIISSVVVFFASFILVLPILYLCNNESRLDIVDLNEQILGKFGKVFSIIYSFYFILVCAHALSTFKIFITSVIDPPISFLVLATSIIVFACYASSKGIESIARTSSIILFFISFLLVFIGFSLFKLSDFTNFRPFFYDGYNSFKNGSIFMISRMSCIPAMGMLISMSKGNIKKGILVWNIITCLLMVSSIFFVTGVLGDLSLVKLFPIYTSTSVAKISKFENLDFLYIGLWTAAVFLKISMFLNLSSECLRKSFRKENNRIIIFLLGITLIFVNMFSKISNIFRGIFDTNIFLILTVSTSFVIPCILLICKKRGKNEKIKL